VLQTSICISKNFCISLILNKIRSFYIVLLIPLKQSKTFFLNLAYVKLVAIYLADCRQNTSSQRRIYSCLISQNLYRLSECTAIYAISFLTNQHYCLRTCQLETTGFQPFVHVTAKRTTKCMCGRTFITWFTWNL